MAKTAKGRDLNMEALRRANEKAVALGNARMNARGDLLGKGGKVIKTREELAREYHTKNPKAVKNVPLSDEIKDMLDTPKAKKAPKMKNEEKENQTKSKTKKSSTKTKTKKETKVEENINQEESVEESKDSDSQE